MTVFLITLLWLCSLSQTGLAAAPADSIAVGPVAAIDAAGPVAAIDATATGAADTESSAHHMGSSSMVSLLANHAVQLQQLIERQQKQDTRMQQLENQMLEGFEEMKAQGEVLQQHSTLLQQLQAQQQEKSEQESSLKKRGQATPSEAFRAEMLAHNRVLANQPIVWDELKFNLGEGHFNNTSGVYTVGNPGVFWLGFQAFPAHFDSVRVRLFITQSSSPKMITLCYNAVYATSCATSSVFRLNRGDTVWVQPDREGDFFAGIRSFFSGVLISPDP